MVPVAIALAGIRLSNATVLFMAWFGPRGLASIVLGLVYLEQEVHSPGEPTIRLAVMATISAGVSGRAGGEGDHRRVGAASRNVLGRPRMAGDSMLDLDAGSSNLGFPRLRTLHAARFDRVVRGDVEAPGPRPRPMVATEGVRS